MDKSLKSLTLPTLNFLSLPPEIRNEIYKQYLRIHFKLPPDEVWNYSDQFGDCNVNLTNAFRHHQPALLIASKQVYSELCDTIRKNAFMRLIPMNTEVYDLDQHVPLDQVLNLTVEMYAPQPNREDDTHIIDETWVELLFIVQKLGNRERFSRLQGLEIVFLDIQYANNEEIRRAEENEDEKLAGPSDGYLRWHDIATNLPIANFSEAVDVDEIFAVKLDGEKEEKRLWDSKQQGVYTDLHLILETFSRLTHLRKVKVHLPEVFNSDERMVRLARETETVMIGKQPELQREKVDRIETARGAIFEQ